MTTETITFHGVLAGAYKARSNEKTLLVHASANGAETSLCGKIKDYRLCDEELEAAELTCPACIARLATRAKKAAKLAAKI